MKPQTRPNDNLRGHGWTFLRTGYYCGFLIFGSFLVLIFGEFRSWKIFFSKTLFTPFFCPLRDPSNCHLAEFVASQKHIVQLGITRYWQYFTFTQNPSDAHPTFLTFLRFPFLFWLISTLSICLFSIAFMIVHFRNKQIWIRELGRLWSHKLGLMPIWAVTDGHFLGLHTIAAFWFLDLFVGPHFGWI